MKLSPQQFLTAARISGVDSALFDSPELLHVAMGELAGSTLAKHGMNARQDLLSHYGFVCFLNELDDSEEENATVISFFDQIYLSDLFVDAVPYTSPKARTQVVQFLEQYIQPEVASPRIAALGKPTRFEQSVAKVARNTREKVVVH